MPFILIFSLLFSLNSLANYQDFQKEVDVISKTFLLESDEKIFKKAVEKFSDANFSLKEEMALLETEGYKKALNFLYITKVNGAIKNVSFSDISRLYFANPSFPKKDLIYSKIRNYVSEIKVFNDKDFAEKLEEIEAIIWFYIIVENENLLSYLSSNKLSVNDFIKLVLETKNITILQNILNLKLEEISEMLWDGNVSGALPLILSLPSSEEKTKFLARIFFKTKNEKYRIYAKTLIENGKFEDDGFVYDYLQYLKKTEHYKDALALILESKINYSNTKIGKLWLVIEELFRYYIDKKEYNQAYLLLSSNKFSEENNFLLYSRAEFLSGFVALRFLKDHKRAIKHFEKIYNSNYGNVYSKARGAYFLYRSFEAMGRRDMTKTWLVEASKYITTFYGIAALDKLNNIDGIYLLGEEKFTQKKNIENIKKKEAVHKEYFDALLSKYYNANMHFEEKTLVGLKNNINFNIGLIMLSIENIQDANSFFSLSVLSMSEKELKFAFDLLSFKLNKENFTGGNQILNTFSSKAANQGVLIVESYPILDFVIDNDFLKQNSLIHAVIKQESNFTLRAISGPGAIGLMQIMPATGRIVSKSVKLDFNLERLKNDYKYNIQLGSYYLDALLKKFQMAYPFALAGYNAGPNRVPQWQKRYFDPKTEEDMIDFIELIPFKETREYVLRVMENEVFYNYLIANHLESSNLPLAKKDQTFNEFLKKHGTGKVSNLKVVSRKKKQRRK